MNIGNELIKKAIKDLVASYKNGLEFVQSIEQDYNNSGNLRFITHNFQTIQSNEKLITLYGSILKESTSITSNTSINLNVPSIECGHPRLAAIEQSTESRSSIEVASSSSAIDQSITVPSIGVDHEMPVEPKREVIGKHGTQEHVDLTRQQVRFKETVTIINSSTRIDLNRRRRDTKLMKKDSHLGAHCAKKVREGQIRFTKARSTKCTYGLCFFCDEKKAFNKSQWQLHLLSHTMESFFCCDECGLNFSKRKSHTTCSPNSIQNIYQRNNCSGDDYLAAFMCKVCNYVRVNEQTIVCHMRDMHADVYDAPTDALRLYEKCKFVTNL